MDRLAASFSPLFWRCMFWATRGLIWYQGEQSIFHFLLEGFFLIDLQVVLVPSSIALVFSVMMTSLPSEYYHFILAQGIVEGLSCGMIFTLTVSTVGQYFTTKRAWAMGVVSGVSVGGVIFPIALNRMLNH